MKCGSGMLQETLKAEGNEQVIASDEYAAACKALETAQSRSNGQ